MNILVVSNMYPDKRYPTYGIFVKRFCDELSRLNIKYDYSVMKKASGKVRKILNYIEFYLKTISLLIFNHYDIVYVHYASHSSLPVLIVSHLKKLHIYVNVHGSDVIPQNEKQEKMQQFTKKIIDKSQKIIVPSSYFKKVVMEKYAVVEDKISIFPSAGIDPNIFHPIKQENSVTLKQELGLNNDIPIFGFASRISRGKGWDIFVQAIGILKEKGINAQFVLVGSGPQVNQLDFLIKSKGLDNSIIRLDLLPQTKLADFYNVIDFFVFPTQLHESLGLVGLESMACGTPIIASKIGAVTGYLVDESNGFSFTAGSAEGCAEAMTRGLTLKPKVRVIMQENALKTARKYYKENIEKCLIKILKKHD